MKDVDDVLVQDLHMRDVWVLALQAPDKPQIVGSHGAQVVQTPQAASRAWGDGFEGVCGGGVWGVHGLILPGHRLVVLNRIDTLGVLVLHE
jgi:hypothetical protein